MRVLIALLAALLASPALAGTIYVQTTGAATNSGSTDTDAATLSNTTAGEAGTTISLNAGTDLSAVVTAAGPTQSSIYLTNATVSNRKIFWITAKDDGADTVTVDTDPVCTADACGAWAIGGRFVWTSASIEGSLRAGDTVIINDTPATKTADFITMRTSGDGTSGYITVRGKTGVRPVLGVTNTNQVIECASQNNWWFENLEFDQDGASGNVVAISSCVNMVFYNIRIVDGGGVGINSNNLIQLINSEITGITDDGVNLSAASGYIVGNYIHDNGGDGLEYSTAGPAGTVIGNIFDTNAGRGVFLSGGSTAFQGRFTVFEGNTIYGNGNSGFEVTDADTEVALQNNIFQENGNAANEWNVEWAAGNADYVSSHGWNNFYHSNCQGSGTGGPACVTGLTVGATEINADSLMVNPGSGDFDLQSASPCKGVGLQGTFLGGSTVSYNSMGASQVQATSSGGACIIGGG